MHRFYAFIHMRKGDSFWCLSPLNIHLYIHAYKYLWIFSITTEIFSCILVFIDY